MEPFSPFSLIIAQPFKWNNTSFSFQIFGSVHGEEVPYFLGSALLNEPGGQVYNRDEKLLSEIVMNYCLNFVKTG